MEQLRPQQENIKHISTMDQRAYKYWSHIGPVTGPICQIIIPKWAAQLGTRYIPGNNVADLGSVHG